MTSDLTEGAANGVAAETHGAEPTASPAAPASEAAADATPGQPSEKLEDSQAMAAVKSEAAAAAMDAEMGEVAPAETEAAADEKPEVASEPVTIGFRTFASGTACCDYFRGLLTKLSHEQDLNEYEFTMVMDLLRKGHPDPEGKIGAGVRAIQIRPHEKLDSICFFVLRTDGSAEDFSYRKCISKLFPDLELPVRDSKEDRNKRGGRGGREAGGGKGRGGRGGRGRDGGRGRSGRGRGRG